MKFKDRLIRIILIFIALLIPTMIYIASIFSSHMLGGFWVCVLYTPFLCFIHYLRSGKIDFKVSAKPKKNDSVRITPEMPTSSAKKQEGQKANQEQTSRLNAQSHASNNSVFVPGTNEHWLKEIDTCLQKAISDCAQGKISSKELADICALLRKKENESSISDQKDDVSIQRPHTEETYLIENDDGMLIKVPASRLEAWEKADHDAPLTPAEKRLKEKILEEIYGPETDKDNVFRAYPKEDKSPNQLKPESSFGQDFAYEKPIGCIPNSSYVPIPWWRNGLVLARVALGLVAVVLICTAIYTAVPALFDSVSDPTTRVSNHPAVISNPLPNNEPLPRPRNGYMLYTTGHYGERIASLTIDASSLTQDFCIKLRRPDTKAEVASFYIHGNTKKTVKVPLGSFEILYASGTDWYGSSLLFGSETSYCLFEGLFDFYEEDGYINGWTITLEERYNGNLDSNEISADEFFGS